jgi:hypothetical protein
MRIPSLFKRAIPCLVVAGALTMVPQPAGASAGTSTKTAVTHCVVYVVGQTEDGEYLLSDEECYSDFGSAMQAAGLGSGATTVAKAESIAASIQSTLAVHYDGANYTGSSFSVSGVDCLGGYINMSATWDNRVSSTFSTFCPRVRHWTGANTTGSYQDTLSSGNLSSPVNNAVSSIQYLS